MIRVAATAVAVLALAQLVEGAIVGLGDRLLPGCIALVLIGVGLGALARVRVAWLARVPAVFVLLLVALLVPLSSVLCDAGPALLGASATASWPARLVLAGAALGPPSLLIGWLLGALLHGALSTVILGVVAGELLIWAGATGWLSQWLSGATTAAALLLLAALGGRRRASGGEAGSPVATPASAAQTAYASDAPHALLLGAATALFVTALARLVPGYTTPSIAPATDALAALLMPAALVAWPAAFLARGARASVIVAVGGALLLAVAVFHAIDALSLYLEPMALVGTTRNLHVQAARLSPWANDWWLWLLSFAALGASALGLAVAPLPARAASGMACGAGLALLAQQVVTIDPLRAPATWMLVSSACAAAAAAPALLGRRGWWLSPLALLLLLASPFDRRPGFDEVRRPGELGVQGFERTPLLDIALYETAMFTSTSVEGRLAQRTTFSCDHPELTLGADGEFALPPEDGTCLGLRLGGLAWNPHHDPLGAAGSVGRLTRLLAVEGRALVAGPCAELLAADLDDAGLLTGATVASDAPLGGLSLVVLASIGSRAWQAANVREPERAAREADATYDTILLAPTRASWPGATTLCSEEMLERLAERLAADGRCLLWLDTIDLDADALRARVAAFGQVFGQRAAAFVEPRELDPPLVLLVGWRLEEARPRAGEIEARLAKLGAGGRRVPLRSAGELGALLLRDGAGMSAAGAAWHELRGSHPAPPSRWSTRGWAAVAAIVEAQARPDSVIDGAPTAVPRTGVLYEGLATHAGYEYDLADLNDTVIEIQPDVDWQAFDREAACYERAAQEHPDDPLLQHALASLLEPLALSGDYGRFARVFEATGARRMRNVRLAVLEAWVQRHSLEEAAAQAALQRAREWSSAR